MNTNTSTTAPTIRVAALALGAGVLLLAGCAAAPTGASPDAPAGDASVAAPMDPGMDMPMEAGPGSHTHGSRHTLYASLSALADDSVEVVTGTVVAQREVADLGPSAPATVSTVRVTSVAKTARGVAAGNEIEVRQIGTAAQPGPAAMLASGSTYLLYLRPSRLPGDAATQWFVTGGSAGIFAAPDQGTGADAASGPSATFARVDHEQGDVLPERVAADHALG
ncbi:hypothetical protein ITJ44_11185 [Clavibacter sp. VKM Ac-2873]|uniref:hypothetical protein n=1 Tax=Clavibacter sp. VKM Ac-2873 TaxID=2783813 RepID=UPI00188D975C|nr:hypothetical protein [Clavibacter sp. VKM Ac-2873]MBF4618636.1 hypothetical protein [Clavibacter sp. VKM Ac-2873]